jgi:hypothetical protein
MLPFDLQMYYPESCFRFNCWFRQLKELLQGRVESILESTQLEDNDILHFFDLGVRHLVRLFLRDWITTRDWGRSHQYDLLYVLQLTLSHPSEVRVKAADDLSGFALWILDHSWSVYQLMLSQPLDLLRKAGTDFSGLVSSMLSKEPSYMPKKNTGCSIFPFMLQSYHLKHKKFMIAGYLDTTMNLFEHENKCLSSILSSITLKLLPLHDDCRILPVECFTDKEFFQFCKILQNAFCRIDRDEYVFNRFRMFSRDYLRLYQAVVGHIRARITGFELESGGIFFAHSVIQLADTLSAPDGSSLRLMAVFCTVLMASAGRANCETIGEALEYVAKHLPNDSVVTNALAYYEVYKQEKGHETQAISSDFSEIDPLPAYSRLNVNNRYVMDKNAIETWLNSSDTSEWRDSNHLPRGYFKCPVTGVETNISDCSDVLDVPKFDGLRGVALYLQQKIGQLRPCAMLKQKLPSKRRFEDNIPVERRISSRD